MMLISYTIDLNDDDDDDSDDIATRASDHNAYCVSFMKSYTVPLTITTILGLFRQSENTANYRTLLFLILIQTTTFQY